MNLLKSVTCYEFLPLSAKVAVLDSSLLVANAVGALLQNGFHSAPLYDTITHSFVGMFTVTDLIRLILYLDKSCGCYDEALTQVSSMTLKRLNDLPFRNFSPESLVQLKPDATLLDAAKTLLDLRIHRLPVVSDDNLILSVLSQSKIVRFIARNVPFQFINFKCQKHQKWNSKISELDICSKNVNCVQETILLREALFIILEQGFSALPIVDENDQVLDVFEKYDVLELARYGPTLDLNITLGQAISSCRSLQFEGIHTASLDDTLGSLMETTKRTSVHRFIVINQDRKVQGIIALQDILNFFLREG